MTELPLTPLQPRCRADRVEAFARLEAELEPWRRAGVLASIDAHALATVVRLYGVEDPAVRLAMALALRAPRYGHIGLKLHALTLEELAATPGSRRDSSSGSAPGAPPALPPLPEDREDWSRRIAAAPGVASAEEAADAGATHAFVLHAGLLYTRRYWDLQEALADALRARATAPLEPAPEGLTASLDALFGGPTGAGLDRQRLAAALGPLGRLLVITGGPGTGKTRTLRSLLALWLIERARTGGPPLRIALAAPTGKAAARMRESIREGLNADFHEALARRLPAARATEVIEALQALDAATLHRLLGYNHRQPLAFRHDAENPLPHDLVVVDEASMVDLGMMSRLVAATPASARLILLGDRDQLASVEAGTVLADLCDAARPAGRSVAELAISAPVAAALTEAGEAPLPAEVLVPAGTAPGLADRVIAFDRTFRFKDSSGIAAFARAVIAGDGEAALAVLSRAGADPDSDLRWIRPRPGRGGLAPALERLVEDLAPIYHALDEEPDPAAGDDIRRRWQLGLLAGLDRVRALCAHRVGRRGSEALNQRLTEALAARFPSLRPEGEVWHGRPILIRENDAPLDLYNGDIGLILREPSGRPRAIFPGREPGTVRSLSPSRLPAHRTVFAMTIHKSQGSELDHAVLILPESVSPILTRELLYTGATRARERLTVVAGAELLRAAVAGRVQRASGLAERLTSVRGRRG